MRKQGTGNREQGTGKIFRPESRDGGVILLLAMFVMLVVAALVLGILQLRAAEVQTLGNKMRQAASQYLADAGIEQAIWYLRLYKQPMWEWGDPNYTGVVTNDAAGSATGKVWGTRLNENFPNGIFYQEKLVSPEITVSSAAPDVCFCDLLNNDADADDDVRVIVTEDGGKSWAVPADADASPANEGDALNAWTRRTVTLPGTVVSGDKIRVGFVLYTDGNLNDPGWYIDNVIVDATTTCSLACGTAPTAPYDFYDDMENGVGNWEYWIEPVTTTLVNTVDYSEFPNDYPANSGNYYWIGFDPRFAASNEWIILGRGIYGTNTGKVEAKVQIVGGSSPYTVKILYWKRIM